VLRENANYTNHKVTNTVTESDNEQRSGLYYLAIL